MRAKEIKEEILRFLGNHLLSYLVTVLCKTLRIEIKNDDAVKELNKNDKNFVLAFWHGTMLIPWFIHRDNNFAGIVSQSKDGQLLVNILEKWNYEIARGSSHKGGKEALQQLIDFANEGYSVAITPDGPTGPRKEMKAGAVITAQRCSVPLVLLAVKYEKKRKLNSWDKFEIPKFFSRVKAVYSDPIYISENAEREEINKNIKECEKKLNNLIN